MATGCAVLGAAAAAQSWRRSPSMKPATSSHKRTVLMPFMTSSAALALARSRHDTVHRVLGGRHMRFSIWLKYVKRRSATRRSDLKS